MEKAIKILALACAAAMTFTACSNSDNQAEQTYSEAEETVQTTATLQNETVVEETTAPAEE